MKDKENGNEQGETNFLKKILDKWENIRVYRNT